MKQLALGNYRGQLSVKEEDGAWYMAVGCDLYPDYEWDWVEITEDLYKLVVEELSP